MLQAIRTHAQGWIAGIIIGILSLVFALWGIQYYLHSGGADEVVAKVNGEEISNVDLQATYKRLRQQMRAQLGEQLKLTPELQKILRKQALQSIIYREVLSQAAADSGFVITSAQVSTLIQQLPLFQVNGQFSPQMYRRVLSNFAYSEDSFYRQHEQLMLISQLESGIIGSAFSLSNEVKQAVVLTDQTRHIGYTVIPVKDYSTKVKVSDADIKTYYDNHQKDFVHPPEVSVQYIELNAEQLKQKIKVSEQDIQDYYQNNAAAFKTKPRWKIQRINFKISKDADTAQITKTKAKIDAIAKQLAAGKKFASFAPTKAKWIEASHFNAPIVKAIKDLQPGEVTEPATIHDSFVIIKLVKYDPPKTQPLADIKDSIKELLHKQHLEHDFQELSNQLSENAYTIPDSLQVVADNLGLKLQTTGLFPRSGGNTELTRNTKVLTAAFSLDVLHDGNNSSLIEIQPGHVLVLRIKDHKPEHPRPIAEVKADIIKILKIKKSDAMVAAAGEKLLKQLNNSKTFASTVKQSGFTWHEKQKVTRQQPEINGELLNLAFSLPDPAVIKKPSITGRSLSNGDYAIVAVSKINQAKHPKISEAQQRVFSRSIERGYGKLEYDLFVNSLMKEAKIKIYNGST